MRIIIGRPEDVGLVGDGIAGNGWMMYLGEDHSCATSRRDHVEQH
jgi:hypothetical protein